MTKNTAISKERPTLKESLASRMEKEAAALDCDQIILIIEVFELLLFNNTFLQFTLSSIFKINNSMNKLSFLKLI